MKNRALSLFGFAGIILTLSELILKLFHSSICSTQGCIFIANSVKYSDSIIVVSGLAVFVAIFLLSFKKDERSVMLINQLLIISLSAEGVFVGYQLFRAKHICLFCISIFGVFLIISLIQLSKKHFYVITGFASFFTILFLFYILKPVNTQAPTMNKPLVLIYKKGCSHCEKVIQEAKKNKINICMIKANSCMALLKSLNIKEVPLLIINKSGEKKIIIGEQRILQYLLGKQNIPKNNLYNSIFKDKKGFCTIGEKCK